jgi:hypothetical protein
MHIYSIKSLVTYISKHRAHATKNDLFCIFRCVFLLALTVVVCSSLSGMVFVPCSVYPVCLKGGGYSCPFSRYSINTELPHVRLINGTSTRLSCVLDSVTVPPGFPATPFAVPCQRRYRTVDCNPEYPRVENCSYPRVENCSGLSRVKVDFEPSNGRFPPRVEGSPRA